MRILDNSTIQHIFDHNISLKEDYFITPDLKDEAEIAEYINGKKLSSKVVELNESNYDDMDIYLNNYKLMLNKHSGRSFFNMTGFGDISILALIKSVIENSKAQKSLPGLEEQIIIYTQDEPLKSRMAKDFPSYIKNGRIIINGFKDL